MKKSSANSVTILHIKISLLRRQLWAWAPGAISFRLPGGVIVHGLPVRTHKVLQAFAWALAGIDSLQSEPMSQVGAEVWAKVEKGQTLWALYLRGEKVSPWVPELDPDQTSFDRVGAYR